MWTNKFLSCIFHKISSFFFLPSFRFQVQRTATIMTAVVVSWGNQKKEKEKKSEPHSLFITQHLVAAVHYRLFFDTVGGEIGIWSSPSMDFSSPRCDCGCKMVRVRRGSLILMCRHWILMFTTWASDWRTFISPPYNSTYCVGTWCGVAYVQLFMRIYIYTRVCTGVRFVLLTASAFCRLEEGQRRRGVGWGW